jgi:hypothetical protein
MYLVGSIGRWRDRCRIEKWVEWDASCRKRYCTALGNIRQLNGMVPLGRKFSNYYPDAVVERTVAYINKQLHPETGDPKKSTRTYSFHVLYCIFTGNPSKERSLRKGTVTGGRGFCYTSGGRGRAWWSTRGQLVSHLARSGSLGRYR